MTVMLPDLSTRTVNADDFSIDDQGNLVLLSGGTSVCAFASKCWAGVWRTSEVSTP